MKISTTISKLGGIPSLNLPALITCRCDAPCKKGCYACKGRWLFNNVQDGLKENLNEFIADGKKFFDDVVKFVENDIVIYRYFRWFSSGDIVNRKFFDGMIDVAKRCKNTTFLCFTKKYKIVNDFLQDGGKLPKNLKIVFSGWDAGWKVENPFGLPMSFVKFKDEKRNCIPSDAFHCKGDCKDCRMCWKMKNGQSVYFDKH